MGTTIDGGTILARLLLEDKEFKAGLNRITSAVTAALPKIKAAVSKIGETISGVGARMAEMGEKLTFIGGAVFAPMVLSMKSFADKNAEARAKVQELSAAIAAMPQGMTVEKAQAQQQLQYYMMVIQKTQSAANSQNQLINAFKTLNNVIAQLLWQTLGPFVPQIVAGIQAFIAWIKAHKELAASIVKVVAAVGLIAIVVGPLLAVGGKFMVILGGMIGLIAALINPVTLAIAAFSLFLYLFRDQIYPELEKHIEKIKEIWKEWIDGKKSIADSLTEAARQIWNFLKNILAAILDEGAALILKKISDFTGATEMEILFRLANLSVEWDSFLEEILASWKEFIKNLIPGYKTLESIMNYVSGLGSGGTAVSGPGFWDNLSANLAPTMGSSAFTQNNSFPSAGIATTDLVKAISEAVKSVTQKELEKIAEGLK
ncbi:MAG: hypothetical protein AB1656_05120 [Candidatus Omnitrophota bacterium]